MKTRTPIHVHHTCQCGITHHVTDEWDITEINGHKYLWFNCENMSTHLIQCPDDLKFIPVSSDKREDLLLDLDSAI